MRPKNGRGREERSGRAGHVEVVLGVTVASLMMRHMTLIRAALVGPTQQFPKRRRLRR